MIGQSTAHQLTDRIRQASDIMDVVSAYVTLRRAGRNFKGLCPFHNEKTPSFNVTPDKQTFKCFGCGAGGDVFKFVQLREGVDFLEARAILANRAGINLEERSSGGSEREGSSKLDLERANQWASRWFRSQLLSAQGKAARDYIDARKISPESSERFAIGFAPGGWTVLVAAARQADIPQPLLLSAGLAKPREDGSLYDAFRDRLIFPIVDAMGRTVGFGGRTLADDDAKYLNSPQSALFDKSRCLYGLATAKDAFRESRNAILVEGYIDCIMAQQHGFTQAVATLGTALTVEHIRLLSRYVDSVTLVFDSDEAGQRAADSSLPLFLTERLDVRLTNVPEGKDPADFLISAGSEAFNAVLTSALGALEFKWKQVVRRCQAVASPLDRRRAVEEFLNLIVRSTDLGAFDPIQRGLILNQVGKLLGVPADEVNRQLRLLARRPGPSASVGPAAPSVKRQAATSRDDGSAAMTDLLGVLLNEPQFYEEIASEFDPEISADVQLRQIAHAVREMACDEQCEKSLAALLGRFESVDIAARIMDLQAAGLCRGNYEATLRGAVERLRQIKEHNQLAHITAGLRGKAIPVESTGTSNDADSAADDDRSARLAVTEVARRVSHFAAHKHLATPLTAGAGFESPRSAE
ncbi:MAG: DNA primase [Planctomycetia bacterium]|nr:DNA primase [Planctomycetia bacterium]